MILLTRHMEVSTMCLNHDSTDGVKSFESSTLTIGDGVCLLAASGSPLTGSQSWQMVLFCQTIHRSAQKRGPSNDPVFRSNSVTPHPTYPSKRKRSILGPVHRFRFR